MNTRLASRLLSGCTLLAATLVASDALAENFIVMRDSEEVVSDPDGPFIFGMRKQLLETYEATGLEMPEVFSVWTTFPMNGNVYGTYIDPRANDVTGIGFEDVFPPDGLEEADDPAPLRAVLWHNHVFAMDQRAALHRSDAEALDYARYLFLLELSHLWGPDIDVPEPNPGDAIGFPFHWSFFMDRPSPAGGNAWTDNGDGTFTVVQGDPGTVKFSELDLYQMGLAEASEVAPFSVLVPTDVPATPTDPFWGGAFSKQSFAWFDTENPLLTVTATKRALTVDDVIAANGVRTPAAGVKTSFTMGIVLVVSSDATDAEIATASADFAPFADAIPGWFADATSGRGSLDVVTVTEGGGGSGGAGGAGGSGGSGGAGGAGGSGAGGAEDGGGGGCDCRAANGDAPAPALTGLALLGLLAARRRAPRRAAANRR